MPTTKGLVLWALDENSNPTFSKVEMASEDELLIVLQIRKMDGEKIVPRWKTAVNVLKADGNSGWVGIGWLYKPRS